MGRLYLDKLPSLEGYTPISLYIPNNVLELFSVKIINIKYYFDRFNQYS